MPLLAVATVRIVKSGCNALAISIDGFDCIFQRQFGKLEGPKLIDALLRQVLFCLRVDDSSIEDDEATLVIGIDDPLGRHHLIKAYEIRFGDSLNRHAAQLCPCV